MACADEAVTQQEQTYLEALRSATRYEVTGRQLTIWYGDGQQRLNFVSDSQIEGHGGCNGYSGNYQNEGSSIAFSAVVHTEIDCADPALTQQEQTYFEALQSATQYEGLFDRLIISYPGGQLNFTLAMNEATPVPPIDLPEPVTEAAPLPLNRRTRYRPRSMPMRRQQWAASRS